MELVYLWVEEYKNIKNQGFNFSPRFTCEYDEVNKKITIEEKKDYISIFPENINVTVIVGENGSGKSNLLNIIREILYSKKISKTEPDFMYILILSINDAVKAISNFNFNHNISILNNFENLDHYLYLASNQNKIPHVSLGNKKEYIKTKEEYNRFQQNEYSIAKMLTSQYISNINFHLTTFMYLPSKIDIHVNFGRIDLYPKSIFDLDLDSEIYEPEEYNEEKFDAELEEGNKLAFQEGTLNTLFKEKTTYHKFLMARYIKKFGESEYRHFHDKKFLLEKLSIGNEPELTEAEFEHYFKDEIKNIEQFSKIEKNIFFNRYTEFFHFDFIDSENRKFNDLSHGEQTIFAQMLNIYYFSLHDKSNLLFFLDEPDLSLHPEWQRKYLTELHNLLTKMDQKFHIIATSHSPFLLSDLPKENVIFLEKGKQVYPNIETFGANIHTLLSHGFFMKDGLMGEFAKNKINEIMNFLNNEKSPIKDDDEAQKYICIIGEPIVKRQLQRMLDSKKLDKMKEIDALKNQIENLQSRLENLEKKS